MPILRAETYFDCARENRSEPADTRQTNYDYAFIGGRVAYDD